MDVHKSAVWAAKLIDFSPRDALLQGFQVVRGINGVGGVCGASYADAPAVFQPPELLQSLGFFQGCGVQVSKGFKGASGKRIQPDVFQPRSLP